MNGALWVLLGAAGVLALAGAWLALRARARCRALLDALGEARAALDEARRTVDIVRAEGESRLQLKGRQLEQAQRREARAQREVLRWQRAALGPYLLSQTLPLYPDRPCLIEYDAIVARLKGAAFVEAVGVADGAGLSLCRDEGDEVRGLSSLVPLLAGFAERALGSAGALLAVGVVTEALRHVSCRPLPGGAWICASSAGRPVAPLAMDLAVSGALAYAGLEEPTAPEVTLLRGARGSLLPGGAPLAAELEAGLVATAALGLLLYQSGALIAGQVYDGPAAPEATALGPQIEALRGQLCFRLRAGDVIRLDLVVSGGVTLTYLALQAGSPYVLLAVSAGLPVDELHLSALRGRLQRHLTMRPAEEAAAPPGLAFATRRTVRR